MNSELNSIHLSAKSKSYVYLTLLYLISFSVIFRFDYFFDGANRFIPFRIVIFILFIVIIYTFLFKSKFFLTGFDILFILFFLFYFSIVHFLWMPYLKDTIQLVKNLVHFVYILSGFYLTLFLVKNINIKQFNLFLKVMIFLVIIVVSIETYLRFFFPTLDLNSENLDYLISIYKGSQEGFSFDNFYFFKMSSIMFFDSNYVGAFLLIFLCLNYFVRYDFTTTKYISFILIISLILFTLSRAAIFTMIILVILYFMLNFSRKIILLSFLFSTLVSLVFLISINFSFFIQDGSLLTKFGILNSLENFFLQDIKIALFGIGYEIGGYLYSYTKEGYAHVHLAILLGEIGLIGIVAYLIYLFVIFQHIGNRVLIIFIPFLIVGFSLADPWEIGYFWSCGLLSKLNES
jgi:hypothetical protein